MKADSPSATALVIAASTILLSTSSSDRNLVAPGARELCECFLSTRAIHRLLAWNARSPFTRWLWRFLEKRTLPGIVRHYWLRKRWIEDQVRSALIGDGFERLVVVGAGFDTLALRLSREMKEIEFVELDHPATQRCKRDAMRLRALDSSRITFVEIDLSQPTRLLAGKPPSDRLGLSGKKTVVVMEGLLMYFPESRVRELLRWTTTLSSSATRVIFSYMEEVDTAPIGFRPRSRLVDWWLRNKKEPFLWSLKAANLRAFLNDLAMTDLLHASPKDFVLKPSLFGENIVVAEKI